MANDGRIKVKTTVAVKLNVNYLIKSVQRGLLPSPRLKHDVLICKLETVNKTLKLCITVPEPINFDVFSRYQPL